MGCCMIPKKRREVLKKRIKHRVEVEKGWGATLCLCSRGEGKVARTRGWLGARLRQNLLYVINFYFRKVARTPEGGLGARLRPTNRFVFNIISDFIDFYFTAEADGRWKHLPTCRYIHVAS